VKTDLHPALRNLKAVIFDVGGTLIHPDWRRLGSLAEAETATFFTSEQLHEAFYAMLQSVDAELKNGVNSKTGRGAHWVFMDTFRSLGLDEAQCLKIRDRLVDAHAQRHLWCQPDSEAAAVLRALKAAGVRIAVISNTEDGRAIESLALANLSSHLEFIIDSHLVGCSKPDKEIFQRALDVLGLKPHEAAYVGDSYGYDVIGARRAGLHPILLDRMGAYSSEPDLTTIRSLTELMGSQRIQVTNSILKGSSE
jgi:putative hydrolase of the HAD superfamily